MSRLAVAVAGIQARMSSTRLPGKSLEEIGGVPLIRRVWERTRRAARVSQVVVLTSVEASDDPLARYCEETGIPVRRGPLHDVLARYLALIEEFGPRYAVRVTGDSPLVAPGFIDLQLEALEAFDADFAVPLEGRPAPSLAGQGAISARALVAADASDDPLDREHVGSFTFARRRAEFRFVELVLDPVLAESDLRLSVDEAADLEFVRRVWTELELDRRPAESLASILTRLARRPDLAAIHARVGESAANRSARRLEGQRAPNIVGRWP